MSKWKRNLPANTMIDLDAMKQHDMILPSRIPGAYDINFSPAGQVLTGEVGQYILWVRSADVTPSRRRTPILRLLWSSGCEREKYAWLMWHRVIGLLIMPTAELPTADGTGVQRRAPVPFKIVAITPSRVRINCWCHSRIPEEDHLGKIGLE
jgi:hypothetical protein